MSADVSGPLAIDDSAERAEHSIAPHVRRLRLRALNDRLRESLLFLPTLMLLGSLALALLLSGVDHRTSGGRLPTLLTFSPDVAISMLSTIAGAAITTAGVVFSLLVVSLQLASGRAGATPRPGDAGYPVRGAGTGRRMGAAGEPASGDGRGTTRQRGATGDPGGRLPHPGHVDGDDLARAARRRPGADRPAGGRGSDHRPGPDDAAGHRLRAAPAERHRAAGALPGGERPDHRDRGTRPDRFGDATAARRRPAGPVRAGRLGPGTADAVGSRPCRVRPARVRPDPWLRRAAPAGAARAGPDATHAAHRPVDGERSGVGPR